MNTIVAEPGSELPKRKSLRAKGLVATLVLVAYLLGAVVYVSMERAKIYESMQALDQLSQHEKAVALTESAVNGARIDVNMASNAAHADPGMPEEISLYMESCDKLFAALDAFDPSYTLLHRAITRSYEALEAAPDRSNWIDLRESLSRATDELAIRRANLLEQREVLTLGYQRQYDAVTIESLALAALGVAVFGSIAAWFFSRLARDIGRLEDHAGQIVRGTRGVALDVGREDELGRLMHAVNRMAVDLDEREKQIEVDAHRRFHQDKMLAVGALAAGISHEVNNPLAVITGAAQEIGAMDGAELPQSVTDNARLIVAQAERAAQAARRLAEVAAPQASERDWVDVNAMVRRVAQLIGYDRRYRHFVFDTDLDLQLPAIHVSGNAVQQVLMQMLSIACDAMVAGHAESKTLRLQTQCVDGQIEMQLLFPPVLDFDRPEVQRVLLLSRAIIEPLGGKLAFGQTAGPLQRIKLTLVAETGIEQG